VKPGERKGKRMCYVIIGNSTAAIGAVEGIRKFDREKPIVMISDEPYHTYSRPLISYYLGGKVTEDKMYYRDKAFYERNKVKAMLGIKAETINIDQKEVVLSDNSRIPFEKLLIATGGKPFVPPIQGLDKENVFNFIKFDDVKAIKKVAVKGSRAVVVGAGFSGLKAVEALVQKGGVDVTVIDIMSRIMPRVLDETAASIVTKVLRKHGVKVLLNTSIESILGDKKATGVLLKDGKELPCDFIILALGVRCNTDIVKRTGIKVNRGIIVNEMMETNIPGIFAAGDVAEGLNFIENKSMEIAIIPNAYRQGETAGINMAGGNAVFNKGFVMNSMPLLGLPIISAGISEKREGIKTKTISDSKKNSYRKFYFSGNKLVGYLLVNDVDRAGIYTDLIRNETDISEFKDSFSQGVLGLISFPREMRKEKMLT